MFCSRALCLTTLFFSVLIASTTSIQIPLGLNITHDLAAQGDGDHHGIASFYEPNGGVGACGSPIQNSDNAVALSTGEWQGGSLCGKKITVTDTSNGHSVSGVVIRDLCPGCQSRDGNKNNIDLTIGVFQQLDNPSVGLINVNWVFED